MSKLISLTKEKFTIVDDKDYEWLSKFKWFISCSGYASRTVKMKLGWRPIMMHRVICNIDENDGKGLIVDHINLDKLDNRRINLRICNDTQSARNRGINKNNLTGYKGVSYDQKRMVYHARIMVDRKTLYLGAFTDASSAGVAYNKAALVYYKEFAWLNKISES